MKSSITLHHINGLTPSELISKIISSIVILEKKTNKRFICLPQFYIKYPDGDIKFTTTLAEDNSVVSALETTGINFNELKEILNERIKNILDSHKTSAELLVYQVQTRK